MVTRQGVCVISRGCEGKGQCPGEESIERERKGLEPGGIWKNFGVGLGEAETWELSWEGWKG